MERVTGLRPAPISLGIGHIVTPDARGGAVLTAHYCPLLASGHAAKYPLSWPRLAARARALRELIGAALRAAAEALHLLGSCLDAPPRGSKATRGSKTARARPGTGRTEGPRRHPAYPAARDSPGHSPRVAARRARTLPLTREQPDAHLLIVHPHQPPVKGPASLRPCDLLIRSKIRAIQISP